METLMGLNLEGDRLRLSPSLPTRWDTYTIHYRYRRTTYHITVTRVVADSAASGTVVLDGDPIEGSAIPLRDDQREHSVAICVR
jgi:cellobiose phosphorylase